MSFDMFAVIFSKEIFSLICNAVVYMLKGISYLILGKMVVVPSTPITTLEIILMVSPVVTNMLIAGYIMIAERKRMMLMKWYKKLWFCFTFPMFDLMSAVATAIALVTKVEWKPIPHSNETKIDQIKTKETVLK